MKIKDKLNKLINNYPNNDFKKPVLSIASSSPLLLLISASVSLCFITGGTNTLSLFRSCLRHSFLLLSTFWEKKLASRLA